MNTDWEWLTHPKQAYQWRFVIRVLAKAGILFILLNGLFALLQPVDWLGSISIYNGLVHGRERLPYGETNEAYNLSLNNLPTIFASHVVSKPKADDEYRILLIGDSSIWGFLLQPEDTLASIINSKNYILGDGRKIHVYNIGYPTLALTKDLLLLDFAMQYKPDMIVWFTTLRSFPRDKQLETPLVQHNAGRINLLIENYDLNLTRTHTRQDFLSKTIIGQRRALADWWRLQLFGVMWATTGVDQVYPTEYERRTENFEDDDLSWQDYGEPIALTDDILVWDVLFAGHAIAENIPLLLVNEPIFISDGENSDLHYNAWYPRWAYDEYRTRYQQKADQHSWHYLDLWDLIPGDEFTDSPVHVTPNGVNMLDQVIGPAIETLANRNTLP